MIIFDVYFPKKELRLGLNSETLRGAKREATNMLKGGINEEELMELRTVENGKYVVHSRKINVKQNFMGLRILYQPNFTSNVYPVSCVSCGGRGATIEEVKHEEDCIVCQVHNYLEKNKEK